MAVRAISGQIPLFPSPFRIVVGVAEAGVSFYRAVKKLRFG